jgi:hypothetical protein
MLDPQRENLWCTIVIPSKSEWAEEGKGLDTNGYRAEFLELVRNAEALRKG